MILVRLQSGVLGGSSHQYTNNSCHTRRGRHTGLPFAA